MTTVAVDGLVYDKTPAPVAKGFFQRLRDAYREARRQADAEHARWTVVGLGPEQMKEMGYYSDPETGLVYSHTLSR